MIKCRCGWNDKLSPVKGVDIGSKESILIYEFDSSSLNAVFGYMVYLECN